MKNILFFSVFFFALGNAQISKGAVNVVQKGKIERIDKKKIKPSKKQIRKAKILSLFKKRFSDTMNIIWEHIFSFLYVSLFFASVLGLLIGIATQNKMLIWLCVGAIVFLILLYLFGLIYSLATMEI